MSVQGKKEGKEEVSEGALSEYDIAKLSSEIRKLNIKSNWDEVPKLHVGFFTTSYVNYKEFKDWILVYLNCLKHNGRFKNKELMLKFDFVAEKNSELTELYISLEKTIGGLLVGDYRNGRFLWRGDGDFNEVKIVKESVFLKKLNSRLKKKNMDRMNVYRGKRGMKTMKRRFRSKRYFAKGRKRRIL